uniref:ATP-dependent DNA helicase n=1 Tax=Ditylenchus dipsaci TaxID=166011 RepID=A0A915DUI5_9BILA
MEEFSDTMYDTRGTRHNEALRLRRMNRALFLINYMLDKQGGFSNAQCGLPVPLDERGQPMAPASTRQMVDMFYFPGRRFENEDEMDGSAQPPEDFFDRLNEEQRNIIEQVEVALRTIPHVDNLVTTPRLFGVLSTATTGIAATLLFNGGTIHSGFGLGIHIDPANIPQLEYQSFLGQRVRAAQLIIMDEMSMARRDLFDAVENVCRMTAIDGQNHLPFGGKVVVLGYDWKQLFANRGK